MISADLVRGARSGKEVTNRVTQVRRVRLVAYIGVLGRVERKQQCSVAQMRDQGSSGQRDQKRGARVLKSRVLDAPDSAKGEDTGSKEQA